MTAIPWFKVDDGFHGHPKVIGLDPSAVGLWLLAGTWSASYLTDGKIPRGMVSRFGGTTEDSADLVSAGLWEEVDGGFQFHEWAEYQPTKEEVEAERAAARQRMRDVRAKRRKTVANDAGTSESVRSNVQENSDGTTAEVLSTPTHPSPTHPIPSPSSYEEGAHALPSPFCKKHPGGTEDSCRACGNARRRYELAERERAAKPTPLPMRDPECVEHPGYPLPCDRCARERAENA